MTSEDREELLKVLSRIAKFIEEELVANDFDGYPYRLTIWQLSSEYTTYLEKVEIDTREVKVK